MTDTAKRPNSPLVSNADSAGPTRHTSGPWSVSCVRTRESGEPVLQILGANGRTFAFVLYSDKKPTEHVASYADANMMAAAHDLYYSIANSDDAHWTPAMRAAMAKARGNSQ